MAACAVVALFAACGATAPPKSNGSRAEPAKGAYDFRSEGKIPAPAGGSAKPEADVEEMAVTDTSLDVTEAPVPRDTTPPLAAPVVSTPVVADSIADGFRIQVFASADRDVAQQARTAAAARLGIPAYMDLDGGIYKVRVGDYARREDASAALSKVRGADYPDAWIVPARVNVMRAH